MGIENNYEISNLDRHRVMVFPIGKYKTAKFPKLDLSREKAEAVINNFERKVLGETEPFIDSSGKHDEAAPAAAWVKNLAIDKYKGGEALYADVEWTSKGRELVKDKQYRYLSPVLAPHVIPETGEKVYPVLRSLSLTNVPVLRMMPAIQASEQEELAEIFLAELAPLGEEEASAEGEETPTEAQASECEPEAPANADEEPEETDTPDEKSEGSESGKEMNNMQKLVEYFKLSEDASEEDILKALEEKLAEMEGYAEQAKADYEAKLTDAETKLSEVQSTLEAAQSELAEVKKQAHDEGVEHRLAEAISANLITPAEVGDTEHPGWVRELAFSDEALFDKMVESRKGPAVDLSELGSGENEEKKEDGLRPDQRLAKVARQIAEEEKLSLGEAQVEALRRDDDLAREYAEYKEAVHR